MTEQLNEMERLLADLMLSGYTSGEYLSNRFRQLERNCRHLGLETGGDLMDKICQELDHRAHTIQKDDLILTSLICRAVHYIGLCRQRMQEAEITARWDSITGGNL